MGLESGFILFEKGAGWRPTRFQMGPGRTRRILGLIATQRCGWEKEGEGKRQTIKQTRVNTLD